ncbi:MAG: hypothetical protein WAK93_12855, partial [Solirubrobacteraceae bacterium]
QGLELGAAAPGRQEGRVRIWAERHRDTKCHTITPGWQALGSPINPQTLVVDLSSSSKPTLTGTFHSQAASPTSDSFVLDLAKGTLA